MIQGDLTGIWVSQYHNDWICSNFIFQIVVTRKMFFYYNSTLSVTHTLIHWEHRSIDCVYISFFCICNSKWFNQSLQNITWSVSYLSIDLSSCIYTIFLIHISQLHWFYSFLRHNVFISESFLNTSACVLCSWGVSINKHTLACEL